MTTLAASSLFVGLSNTAVVGVALFLLAVLFLVGALVLIARFYRKVDQGKALIVNTTQAEPLVTFTGATVLPIIHRAEIMDISVKTIEIDRRGDDGLICRDNIRADIKVTFFVRVNKTAEDVLKVAQAIGCQRASDQTTLEQLFSAKFSEALKTVGKRLEFEELYTKRDLFRDDIIELIGKDLNGYVLEDAAIDYLEQTPLDRLDPSNILDAQGIRKITEMTAAQNVHTNQLKQKERMDIGSQNLASDEAIFRYDMQRAEAEAKKQRDIHVAQTREQNEARRFELEEQKRTELARQIAAEEVKKREQEMQRNIEVAEKQRQRIVVIETVEVQKAEDLKQIEREREVELLRIDKEKHVERERKDILEVVRTRVAIEKTVAEEEERIKDLRLVSEATRQKDAQVIEAEGAAQSELVKSVRGAEAEQQMARFKAQEKVTLATAELEAAESLAKAKIRLAEGVQAEQAAEGLAAVRVKEVDAAATEKQGLAQANVIRETLAAQAEGEEKQGLARVTVAQADADAIQRRMQAEAVGLTEKAQAMKLLDASSRAHEEFRIALEQQKEIALAKLSAQERLAHTQAEVLGKALANARMQIIGGDGQFFDRLVGALSVANAIDTSVEQSDAARAALGPYMSGEASFREDVLQVLSSGGVDTSSLKNLSIAGALAKLATQPGPRADAFRVLADKARELGID